jgi:hypothetical protein
MSETDSGLAKMQKMTTGRTLALADGFALKLGPCVRLDNSDGVIVRSSLMRGGVDTGYRAEFPVSDDVVEECVAGKLDEAFQYMAGKDMPRIKEELSARGPARAQVSRFLEEHPRAAAWVSHFLCDTTDIEQIVAAELRDDPELRLVLVRATPEQARRSLRAIADELGDAVGSIVPSSSTITLRACRSPRDPSLRVIEPGTSLVGSRIDRLFVINDPLPIPSLSRRSSMREWFATDVLSRITVDGRAAIIGMPWHAPTLATVFGHDSSWSSGWWPLVQDGQSVWPEKYPAETIAAMRERLGPVEAARQIDLKLIAPAP